MSKGLEALERTRLRVGGDYTIEQYKSDYETIGKELKAFALIKEKKVEVCTFICLFIELHKSYEDYISHFENPIEIDYDRISEKLLTQEEFDFLKEALECNHS